MGSFRIVDKPMPWRLNSRIKGFTVAWYSAVFALMTFNPSSVAAREAR
jgi:hypothetical protein